MATKTKKETDPVPSVLAFERKLDPSDAIFSTGNWDDRNISNPWPCLTLREKIIRGTISNRLKGNDEVDADPKSANIQTVDLAALPHDSDTLAVSFTLRILGDVGIPSACNEPAYKTWLASRVGEYRDSGGFAVLAARYARNLAAARFLWRNRLCSQATETHISLILDGKATETWVFDSLSISLRDFGAPIAEADAFEKLSQDISTALAGNAVTLLKITTYARIGAGQEVFPSQEFVQKGNSKSKQGDKSKTLYAVEGAAAFHSQKIGNAIRTIDDWHAQAGEIGPIAVEVYGSVTSSGTAYRGKGEDNFYKLHDDWCGKAKQPDDDQRHYLMAMLIRGGVFGKSSKD